MDIVNDGSRGAYFHTIDPKTTTVLNKIHADIRNIGNNHSMDVGKDGMLSTKAFATQDVWDAYFRGKPEGFFAGEHMDFSHLVPLAAKAEDGAWKESRLETVKAYILSLL